ncbi:MAG: trigger factor [Candidatus Obscuribacterales bacterium]|nr:trigger factor [Candidatus Obscuribacterales bacterium]
MKKTLEREGNNVVKVGVEIEADKALKAYEVACRQVSSRLNIPGFRRGKAPRNIVERAVGVDFLKREALENLVPEVLGQVIVDEKLDIIAEPQLESYEFNLGEPLRLNASFEVRPEVKLGNYRGLKIEVPEAKLPEDSMEKALKSLAEARSTLQTVDPRPAAMGDTLLMDFECYSEGKLVEGGKAEGLLLEMKEGNFLPGFCEQLIGKEPEKQTEVNAKFPDSYRNAELAGKDANFKVTIKEVRTRVMPEINEEFAKSIGQESLETLKTALQDRMEAEIKGENEARSQKLAVDAVVAAAEVEIPDSMIDRECNLLLQHLKRMVEERGQSWEGFVNTKEYPEIYMEKKAEAKQRVLTSLVLGAVVRAESLAVTEEESAPYLAELVSRYNVPVERIRQDEQIRRAFETLSRQAMEEALTRKVVDFLLAQSEINFVPEPEEKEEAKPE